jgi:hypothetical protein
MDNIKVKLEGEQDERLERERKEEDERQEGERKEEVVVDVDQVTLQLNVVSPTNRVRIH